MNRRAFLAKIGLGALGTAAIAGAIVDRPSVSEPEPTQAYSMEEMKALQDLYNIISYRMDVAIAKSKML